MAAQLIERVDPLLDLDRRQLLGRALGGLAVQQRLDDPVDEDPRRVQRDDRDDDDDEDRQDRVLEVRKDPRPRCRAG